MLEQAQTRFPEDREILFSVVLFHRDRGTLPEAARYLRRLAELAPEDARARRLLAELERPAAGDPAPATDR